MPKKLDDCVKALMEQGKTESEAFAICQSYNNAKGFVINYLDKTNTVQGETFNDYPKGITETAKRGIKLNEKVNNRCATQVGKVRAQQLANREPLSFETVKRMYSYLSRAKEYYNPNDTEACGTISYLLWGGEPALSWSKRIVESNKE